MQDIIDRRTVLSRAAVGAIATSWATFVASPAHASVPALEGNPEKAAAAPAEGTARWSELAERIARWRSADANEKAADLALEAFFDDPGVPPVRVECGRRAVRRDEKGEMIWSSIFCSSHEQIDRHWGEHRRYDRVIGDGTARSFAQCHAELDRILAAREAMGATAAERAVKDAEQEQWAEIDKVFACRPQSLADYQLRDLFMAEWLADGRELNEGDIAALFPAPTPAPMADAAQHEAIGNGSAASRPAP